MKKIYRDTTKAGIKSKILPAVLAGVICFAAVMGVLLSAFSFVYTVTELPFYLGKPLVTVALCLAAFLGALVMLQINKKNGLFSGFLFGLGVCVLLAVISLLSKNWQFTSASMLRCIGILAAASLGGSIGVHTKKKRSFK